MRRFLLVVTGMLSAAAIAAPVASTGHPHFIGNAFSISRTDNTLTVTGKEAVMMGDNYLDGGAGIDTLDYTSSNLLVVNLDTGVASGEGVGADTVLGFENVLGAWQGDSITGDANNNYLVGGGGYDYVAGGAGDDTLDGGSGDGDRRRRLPGRWSGYRYAGLLERGRIR